MGRRKKDNSLPTGSHVEIVKPQGVVIGDHAKVVQNFNAPRRLPAASELRDACIKVTKRLVAGIIEDRKIITRETLTNEIDEFLSSEEEAILFHPRVLTCRKIYLRCHRSWALD
jgi:hypothetical protein